MQNFKTSRQQKWMKLARFREHDDVIKWKPFPHYWSFVQGIHQSPVNSAQRPVKRSFDVFFDLRLNKQLSKQWKRRYFEMPSPSLWRQCNDSNWGRVSGYTIYYYSLLKGRFNWKMNKDDSPQCWFSLDQPLRRTVFVLFINARTLYRYAVSVISAILYSTLEYTSKA